MHYFIYIEGTFSNLHYHWRLYLILTNVGSRVNVSLSSLLMNKHLPGIFCFISFWLLVLQPDIHNLFHCQLTCTWSMKRIPTQGFYWVSIFLTFINQEWYKYKVSLHNGFLRNYLFSLKNIKSGAQLILTLFVYCHFWSTLFTKIGLKFQTLIPNRALICQRPQPFLIS